MMGEEVRLSTCSSTAAYHSTRGNPAYNASKAGAVGLTRTLAEAQVGPKIRVNGIAPGLVDTKLTKVTTENPERLRRQPQNIPLGRARRSRQDMATAVALSSPATIGLCRRPDPAGRRRPDPLTAYSGGKQRPAEARRARGLDYHRGHICAGMARHPKRASA